MNTDKAREDIARAVRFKEWAHSEDGLFALFDAVERDYFKTLKTTGITETDVRELVFHRISALGDIRRAIEAVIAQGQSAQAIMADIEKKLARQHVRRHDKEKA